MSPDPRKLEAFMNRMVGELGAAMSTALMLMGDKLGLYKAMAGAGAISPNELAQRTGTNERCIREWLMNQAAGGIVEYDRQSGRFTLPPEQALALADEDSPVFLPGAFQVLSSVFQDEPKLTQRFRGNGGMDWHEHCAALFEGTARFFRPNYAANLVDSWIPALDGVKSRLESGAAVADIGCGFGHSTMLMARAFPRSRFFGFDFHAPSIESARRLAAREGLADRVTFDTSDATHLPPGSYDLATCFDCLHDMGNPVGCAKRIRELLKPDGTWMIVEPLAGDRPEENLNPLGRLFYAASTAICVPCSLASNGPALGAQAGEARLSDVVRQGGFSRVRRAAQTPFNIVLEARP